MIIPSPSCELSALSLRSSTPQTQTSRCGNQRSVMDRVNLTTSGRMKNSRLEPYASSFSWLLHG